MLTGPTGKDKATKSIQSAFSSLQERHIMGQCESKASTANEIQVDTARLGRGEKAVVQTQGALGAGDLLSTEGESEKRRAGM